jgi:citrate lyase subunit gamma (acyl carrier protein)
MIIKTPAIAGSLESSDVMITIKPNEQDGIIFDLQSSVEKQYGQQIRNVIMNTLQELNVHSAIVSIVDKGALDCTLKARMETAIYRASQNTEYRWAGEQR